MSTLTRSTSDSTIIDTEVNHCGKSTGTRNDTIKPSHDHQPHRRQLYSYTTQKITMFYQHLTTHFICLLNGTQGIIRIMPS